MSTSEIDLKPVFTAAGLAAIQAANQQGLALQIAEMALGDGQYAIRDNDGIALDSARVLTGLSHELLRVSLTAGGSVTPNQILLQGQVSSGTPEFWIGEIGFFDNAGTLIAVWSNPVTNLGWRGSLAPWVFRFVLGWTDLPAEAITVTYNGAAALNAWALDQTRTTNHVRTAIQSGGLIWDHQNGSQLAQVIGRGRLQPKWYGATGDYDPAMGLGTDDTVALNACFAAALTLGREVDLGPDTVFYRTTGPITVASHVGVYGQASIVADHDGDAVIVEDTVDGNAENRGTNDQCHDVIWQGPRIVKHIVYWTDGTDTTSRGLVLRNCRKARVLANIEGFANGLVLLGDADGTVHNKIEIGEIRDCRRNLVTVGKNGGWANSNLIFGGRLSITGAYTTAAYGIGLDVQLAHFETSTNDNTLIGVALELSQSDATTAPAGAAYVRIDGLSNTITACRFEGTTTTRLIHYTATATYNKVQAGLWPSGDPASRILDEGSRNATVTRDKWDFGTTVRAMLGGPLEVVGSTTAGHDWPELLAMLKLQDTHTSLGHLVRGLAPNGSAAFGITNRGQLCGGFPGDEADTYGGALQFQSRSQAPTYPGQQGHLTTSHKTVTSADATSLDLIYIVPANASCQVVVDVIGRSADGSQIYQQTITAVVDNPTGTNATIIDQIKMAAITAGAPTVTSVDATVGGNGGIAVSVIQGTTNPWSWSTMARYQIIK